MQENRSPDYPDRSHVGDGSTRKLDPIEARQGVKGHNVRVILAFGTAGAAAAFALMYLAYSAA